MLSNTFYNELMNVISTFSERAREIVLRRLGYNGSCDSLETIGKDLSVTRERVRQIEVSSLETINKFCGFTLTDKLKKCLSNRREPLYLDTLEVEDEWFLGFSDRQVFLAQLIEKLTTYHVFRINGRPIISKINREQWGRLKSETLEHLKSQVPAKLSQKEVNRLVRRAASNNDAGELANLLHESLKDKLHFGSPKGKGPKVLCSVGRGLSNVLAALLVEATEPLHYTELARRCSAKLGRQVEGYVHNNLKELAYLYGRGIYGTLDHLPIGDTERKEILVVAENIILEGPDKRQWTCNELLKALKGRRPSLPLKVDKYVLNIILSESNKLKSVGRLVWIKKSEVDHTKVSRVDLQSAVTEIVEQAGHPVSANEIKESIMTQRGLDEYFTILPTARIARTKPNTWGLVDRDFLLTKDQQTEVLDAIYQLLEDRQEGLHITELKSTIQELGISVPHHFTDYMAMSLTQTDTRFKVRRGQILGLSDWTDGKRVSVREAIENIAQSADAPMTMLELRQSVEEIVKHEVKQPLHRLLENASFVHDERSNTWSVR